MVKYYLEADLKKWWPGACPDCGWRGLSCEAAGGGQIADTGDYDDVLCPKCGAVLDDDLEAKAR